MELLSNLAKEIVSLLDIKQLKIGCAESCSGGLLSSTLTDVPGSSKVFEGSFVSYSNRFKQNNLGVKESTLISFGAVSSETAKEMAKGVKSRTDVDIAISLTGIAGPGGGSADKPIGTLFIGIISSKKSFETKFSFSGNRNELKVEFVRQGLIVIRELLELY